jgi:hypothetical protein
VKTGIGSHLASLVSVMDEARRVVLSIPILAACA